MALHKGKNNYDVFLDFFVFVFANAFSLISRYSLKIYQILINFDVFWFSNGMRLGVDSYDFFIFEFCKIHVWKCIDLRKGYSKQKSLYEGKVFIYAFFVLYAL